MLGVLMVGTAAGYPLRSLVSVGRDAPGIFYHPGQMHEIPGHERRVSVREVVLGTSGAGIQIRGARTGLPDPACVSLRRYHETQMLKRVEDVHRAMLDSVLVAGDKATTHAPIVSILSGGVQIR